MDFNDLCFLFKEDTQIIDRRPLASNPADSAKKILRYIESSISPADERKYISLGRVYLEYSPKTDIFEYTFTQNAKVDLNRNDELKKSLKFNYQRGTFFNFPRKFNKRDLELFLKYVDKADKLSRNYDMKLVTQVYDPDDQDFSGYQTEWPGRISSFKKNWADMVSGFSTFGKNIKSKFSK